MLNKSYPLSRYKANSGKNKKNVWCILTVTLGFLFLAVDTRYNFSVSLKILASNSKWFRVYGIFKNLQIDDDKRGLPSTTIL